MLEKKLKRIKDTYVQEDAKFRNLIKKCGAMTKFRCLALARTLTITFFAVYPQLQPSQRHRHLRRGDVRAVAKEREERGRATVHHLHGGV